MNIMEIKNPESEIGRRSPPMIIVWVSFGHVAALERSNLKAAFQLVDIQNS